MNRWGRLALGLIVAALVLGGCGDKKGATGKDVLVTINGQPVKTQDLQLALNSLPAEQRKLYDSPQGIMSLLDEVVSYRMMALEAENRKLDQDPLFKKRMEMYRQRLLVNSLVEQSMSDADLMNHFQRNFLRARFIRAAFPAGASPEQKTQAKAKADQALVALNGPDVKFEDIIKKFSDNKFDESGEMGYVTHQTIENMTNFGGADALFNLKEQGQHTGVVEGKDGWYIFELVEPPGKLDVRGLTPELASAIRDELREQVVRSMASELKSRKDFKIEHHQDNINELMTTLQQNWAQIGDANTAEPETGSTAAPAPGATTPAAPAPGGTPKVP